MPDQGGNKFAEADSLAVGPVREAPHKPLLLLCLLDMAEAGELVGRTFTRTAGLVLRFKSYGALMSERWPTRLDSAGTATIH
jgi:hypothetical protein